MSNSTRPMVALAVLALLAFFAPVKASMAEDYTGSSVSYQFDGDTTHDAPDTCAHASSAWSFPLGSSTDGLIAPPDDIADVFVVDVPTSRVGDRIDLRITEATDPEVLDVEAYAPGCNGSVLELLNWPTPEPSPPAPADGEAQWSADVSEPWYCDSRQWVFVVDGLHGMAPAESIHVAWTDGTERPVDLSYSYREWAVYATDHNLDILLKGAWINLPVAWAGDFSFAVGPCDAVDGGAVYGDPPVAGTGMLSFTPTKAGPYLVQVRLKETLGDAAAAVDEAAEAAPPIGPVDVHFIPHPHFGAGFKPTADAKEAKALVAGVASGDGPGLPSLMTPKSCHFCLGPVEDVARLISYRVAASVA